MITRKLASAVAALALTTGGLIAVGVTTPAAATGACRTLTSTTTGDVVTSGDATATVTDKGLRVKTPVRTSRARWQEGYSNAFANLTGLSYRTFTFNDGDRGFATIAARVGLDTNGDAATDVTLVYEPYWNGTVTEGTAAAGNTWQTWDAIDGGTGKWWWAEEPGNPQTVRPWSQYQVTYSDAVLTFVNVGMGTWNEGADAKVDELRISVQRAGCKRYVWKKPTTSPSATPSGSPTASPSGSASATPSQSVSATPTASKSPSASPSPSASESPDAVPSVSTSPASGAGGSDGGGLPLTGASVLGFAGGGLLLLAAGGIALVLARRRREPDFTA